MGGISKQDRDSRRIYNLFFLDLILPHRPVPLKPVSHDNRGGGDPGKMCGNTIGIGPL